uniref:DNA repair protein XRCC1 n=1 Tax=Cynoglossus semilaevis TaxID=244447 RepID=A0A3P8VY83_CYNSE
MPEIKIKHVVSCSTEDATHKADNLLKCDTYRKWKAATPGEKQISVILQFEKEEQVHSIDIGNEGSAFVEVLVGNSSAVRDQDYEVLLVTSTFMSPTESRNGTNMNRVRFFGSNQLQKTTAQEKWDRVKIICSQPYSKNILYGLAFVKFHSPPDKNDPPPTSSPKLTRLGQFKIKDEPPSISTSLHPGSLFSGRDSSTTMGTSLKVSPQNTKLTYAAAALQSSGTSHSLSQAPSHITSTPTQVLKIIRNKHKRCSAVCPPNEKSSDKKIKSRSKSEEGKSQVMQQVPFNRIMEGVVFVLSGFQNPFRGELREKALNMGAKYQPDWTSDSTHLICAFANTPKYFQVKRAGGIIVRKEWLLDCHKRKHKICSKRYLMDDAESSSESEMELGDQSEEDDNIATPQKKENKMPAKKTPEKINKDDEYVGSSEAGLQTFFERVEDNNRQKKSPNVEMAKKQDPYEGSTDENTDVETEGDHPIPELPGKHFLLFGQFPHNERRLLLRYIIAFNGVVEEYMSEKVQFVVTSEGWHDSFEEALMENTNLNFVKTAWIYAINEKQRMLPYQSYSVVP